MGSLVGFATGHRSEYDCTVFSVLARLESCSVALGGRNCYERPCFIFAWVPVSGWPRDIGPSFLFPEPGPCLVLSPVGGRIRDVPKYFAF